MREVDMGFIPKDAHWYLADIVLEHVIEGDPRNVVHVDTHLIEAGSPEQAYEKGTALGRSYQREYANTDGKQVQVISRGLRELNVIHESLEDGAELIYEESFGVPGELREWITPKDQLGAFTPTQAKVGCPNYMPESVMRMLETEGFGREDMEDTV
jgi:hypothetical protein